MTKKICVTAAALALAAALVGCDEVKVSEKFGYDPVDSTEIIQKALDSGLPKLVFDADRGPWITRPLRARSNQMLIFEEGAELLAKRGEYHGRGDSLLWLASVTNVVIVGRGKGATFRMWKTDYQDLTKYSRSEWRMALRLSGAANVLVENMTFKSSGGDGICLGKLDGNPCRNVTIRNCVCDDNHRQGISACVFDGLVIEDCVLSNTKGTPPQAGIDIEPNQATDEVCNLVMRNVQSINNAGSGFEVMLHHATQTSQPVNLRFENCVSRGNRTGAVVVGNHVREHDIVRGDVDFVNCSFEEDQTRGIRITGVPKGTLNVRFDNCTVVGNAKSKASDVTIASLGAMQGLPDHVAFNNLKVVKRNGESWFSFSGTGLGPAPSAIRGDVTVVSTNGTTERVALDAQWVKDNIPVLNGGKDMPPMLPFPEFKNVRAVETKPGEMADLAPIGAMSYARQYLLLVPRPMKIRIRARTTGKKDDSGRQVRICRILPDGKRPAIASVPMPGPEGGEITFTVQHCPSFYTMQLPTGSSACCLEQSNVPIALDLTGWSPLVKVLGRQPFSLWFYVPDSRPFAAYAYESGWDRFAADIRDPDGKVFTSGDSKDTHVVLADVPAAQAKPGLWSIDFRGVPKCGGFGSLRVATGNLPGYYFLTKEKYWK